MWWIKKRHNISGSLFPLSLSFGTQQKWYCANFKVPDLRDFRFLSLGTHALKTQLPCCEKAVIRTGLQLAALIDLPTNKQPTNCQAIQLKPHWVEISYPCQAPAKLQIHEQNQRLLLFEAEFWGVLLRGNIWNRTKYISSFSAWLIFLILRDTTQSLSHLKVWSLPQPAEAKSMTSFFSSP